MNYTVEKTLKINSDFNLKENPQTGYKSLWANANFKAKQILTDFSYSKSFKKPTRFTIQLNEEQHIELQPIHLQYINHSCSPNVYFNTQKMQLIALREIKKGDEIVYFYPSTEWKMTEEFLCTCKSNNCLKQIKGAAFLPYDIITRYEISDYIQRKSTQAYNNLPFKNLN